MLPDQPSGRSIPAARLTTNVGRHESLHPATDVATLMRPQQHVEMVCNKTKNSQPHRHLLVSLPHQVHKRGEVVILMKDILAAIAPVQYMVNKPTRDALDLRGMPEL